MSLVNSCFERGLNLYELEKKNDFSYVCARTEYANHIINKLDLRKCFTCIGKIINFDFNNTCNRQKHWFKYVMVKSVSKTKLDIILKKSRKARNTEIHFSVWKKSPENCRSIIIHKIIIVASFVFNIQRLKLQILTGFLYFR